MGNWTDLVIRKLESIVDGFFWMLPNFGFALITLAAFAAGGWAARASIRRVFNYQGRADLGELLGGFAKWSIIAFGLLVVSTIVIPSIRPADALAALGIGSIAIGFAFKDILQNWIAGVLILWREPFRRGDQIIINNYEGTVEHIEARATILKTYDGRRVIIPNSDVYTRSMIVNTAYPKRRSEYLVPIDIRGDVERARRALLDVLGTVEGVERDPAPDVVPWEFGDGEARLNVRWWTNSRRRHVVAARGRVIVAVKAALEDVGIPVPYPSQVLMFSDDDGAAGDVDTGPSTHDRQPDQKPAAQGSEASGRDRVEERLRRTSKH